MLKNIFEFVKKVARGVGKHSLSDKSASLAYYSLFALGPVLLLFVFVGRFFMEEEEARGQVLSYFGDKLGEDAIPFFANLIDNLVAIETGWVFTVITTGIFIFGIYLFFNFLRRSFFEIFGVDFGKSGDLNKKLVNQAFHVLYASLLFVLLFTILVINIGSSVIYNIAFNLFPEILPTGFLRVMVTLSVFILTTVCFALIYWILSIRSLSFKNAFWGGFLATVMITVLNLLLAVYLAISAAHSLYGFAGTLVAFLIWVYYAGMTIFVGAEAARARSLKGKAGEISV